MTFATSWQRCIVHRLNPSICVLKLQSVYLNKTNLSKDWALEVFTVELRYIDNLKALNTQSHSTMAPACQINERGEQNMGILNLRGRLIYILWRRLPLQKLLICQHLSYISEMLLSGTGSCPESGNITPLSYYCAVLLLQMCNLCQVLPFLVLKLAT